MIIQIKTADVLLLLLSLINCNYFSHTTGCTSIDDGNLFSGIKLNKIILDEDIDIKLSSFLGNKPTIKNVLCCYKLAKFFNISNLYTSNFNYIERWFTSVFECKSFLELDFSDLLKILKSSGLLITSELEVYEAAEKWLEGCIKERKKFAKNLLCAVRLPLLSNLTLKKLLNKTSTFTKLGECNKLLREVLENKISLCKNMSSSYTTTRYCDQKLMNILVCGGTKHVKNMPKTINQIDVSNFEVNVFPAMTQHDFQVVCLKGDLYLFCGSGPNNMFVGSVLRYSVTSSCWNKVAEIPDRLNEHVLLKSFCACAFVDKLFVFGGFSYQNTSTTNCCLQFHTNDCDFKRIAGMIEPRSYAACAVFEEKLVVSGGSDNFNNFLNTVECYDVTGDESWTRMPSMTRGRDNHSLVVVRNKLIAVGFGIKACEVYTTNTGRFAALKSPALNYHKSVQLAGKIFVFQINKAYVWVYDVGEDFWKKEKCDVTKHIFMLSCATMPIQ